MAFEWSVRYQNIANSKKHYDLVPPFRWPKTVSDPLDSMSSISSRPFRLLDLPFEIRGNILYLAIYSPDNIWLDREVISLESLLSNKYIRGRIVWRGSNGVFQNLLLTNKQIHDETEQVLYSRFAFDARGWGYTMKYSDPSKTPNRLPKHRIMHISYTPYLTYMREHRESARLILSDFPLLCTVRILLSWQCTQNMIFCGTVEAGTQHIMAVARLFREVGKVAIVGQSPMSQSEKKMVEDAREDLKDEPWYWELCLDYPLFVSSPSYVEEHL